MTTHLVIPDCHVKPGIPNYRFTWLANFILDIQPGVIVQIGDFADMESLSSYDKGKKCFEGRRYKEDINSANDALGRFSDVIVWYNQERKFRKKKQYHPRLVYTMGNHENRINRAIEQEPILEGTISTDDIKFKEHGWEVHNFMEVVIIDGIAYSHYFCTNGSTRAIGGINAARSILLNNMHSSTCGHLHGRHYAEHRTIDGRTILCHVSGHFMDTHQKEEYAGPQGNNKWGNPSITLKHNVVNGEYDIEIIPLEAIRKNYG